MKSIQFHFKKSNLQELPQGLKTLYKQKTKE